MKFKKLLAVVAVVFVAAIQMGCGTSQQGNCGVGQLYQNGVCTTTGMQNGLYNNYNTGGACSSGASYAASTYGCAAGYLMQGNQCVCSSTTGITNGTTNTNGTNGCAPNNLYINYPQYGAQGCFMQGQCAVGYAFHTPSGYCFRAQ